MAKKLLLATLVLVSLAAIAKSEEKKGFTPIFNGKDLTGWEGEEGFWSVEEGAITGRTTPEKPCKHSSYLMWRGEPVADFELRFSFRIESGNSGVQFRSRELENWDIGGYQADFDANNQWTGCLYDCNSHRADPNRVIGLRGQKVVIDADGKRHATKVADPGALLEHVKNGEWNAFCVIAKGPLVTLKINGVVMTQVVDHEKDKAPKSGIFGVQIHQGPPMKVQIKDVRLKRLD